MNTLRAVDEFNDEKRIPKSREDLLRVAEGAGETARADRARELDVPSWARMDERWTCPRCGESHAAKYNGITTEFDPCQCQRTAYEEAKKAFLASMWSKVAEAVWESANIAPRFHGARFSNFTPRSGTEEARKLCGEYADAFRLEETQKGIILVGGFGCGKTHLIVSTARAIVEQTLVRVHFTTTPELLAEIKARFGNSTEKKFDRLRKHGLDAADPLETAKQAELLVLDDIAQEGGSDFDRATLYDLIDTRYRNLKPTLLSSNCGSKQLAERLGGAVASRITEMTTGCQVKATDYRVELAKRGA